MNQVKRYLLLLIVLLSGPAVMAQTTEPAASTTGGNKGSAGSKTPAEQRGDEHYALFNYRNAIVEYEASPLLSTRGMRRLAVSHLKMGNYSQCERVYSALVNQTDCLADDLYEYAVVLRSNNKYEEADLWMEKYISRVGINKRIISNQVNAGQLQQLLEDKGNYEVKNLGLNTDKQEFSPALFGDQLVFSASSTATQAIQRRYVWTNERFLDLFVLDSGDYNSPVRKNFKQKFNKKFHEGVACFTPDGKRMFFTTNYSKDKGKNGEYNLQLFYADLNTNGRKWNKPVSFTFNDPSYSVGHPSVSSDGKTLYFASNMPGSLGGVDLWKSTLLADSTWSLPVNLGPTVNTESDEMYPFIQSENNLLFFASNGHFGIGGLDLFFSLVENGKVSQPTNLGAPLNSPHDDFSLIISGDLKTGYLSSNRYGGKGNDDIYAFTQVKTVDYNPQKLFTGVTKYGESPLADVSVRLYDQNNKLLDTALTGFDGKYSFKAENKGPFTIKGIRPGYKDAAVAIPASKTDLWAVNDVPMNVIPVEPVRPVVIDTLIASNPGKGGNNNNQNSGNNQNNSGSENTVTTSSTGIPMAFESIYFDYSSASLSPDSRKVLDRLVKSLNKNPKLTLELLAYTDCRGKTEFNDWLAGKRMQATLDYIRKKISNPTRVSGKAIGEIPSFGCDCDAKTTDCPEDELKKSRRVDFVVIVKK